MHAPMNRQLSASTPQQVKEAPKGRNLPPSWQDRAGPRHCGAEAHASLTCPIQATNLQ